MAPDIERRRDLPLADVLELQRQACARAGSALYDRILAVLALDEAAAGATRRILGPWAANAMADAVPLRLLAALHDLVLSGRAPALARHYPSSEGHDPDVDPARLATDVLDALEAHEATLVAAMPLGVQTNEPGRAVSLVGPLHLVATRSALPLRQLEVGASGGLLLHLDRYRYEADGGRLAWGPVDSPVRFVDPWDAAVPPLAPTVVVAERRGCDPSPIDPTTEVGAARLRSFLWPDQVERRARLDAAIAVARTRPVAVERASADVWLAEVLAEPVPGTATVVHHSIVLQYLPRPVLEGVREVLAEAGRRATPEAPVHWLRMEPAGPVADLRLRTWAGGEPSEELLGTTTYHGPPVTWTGPTG